MSWRHSRRLGLLAIVVLALAAGTVMQASGDNQSSHYALMRSIASGTPQIDSYEELTNDKAFIDGHWYSSRAPGVALLSLPAYELLELVGVEDRGDAIWALGLWAALLPAALILVMVRRLGDRVASGLGTPAAVALGAGTLLLPFSTMLFSHVLSAALAFAAFALLWHEREGSPRIPFVAASGLLVGLGVTTEYPVAIAGIALGLYAVAPRPGASGSWNARLARAAPRGLAYGAGAILGVAPLIAYNAWAFGSPLHVAYADIDQHQSGFFGIGLPSPAVAVELLGSSRGLLTLAPILALAVPGLVLLHRRGWRAESMTIAGIALGYLVYNAGYWLPFGGWTPGPRFLVSSLPFLGVPLALAFKRLPGPAIALAVASAVLMAVATITGPLIANHALTEGWGRALLEGRVQETVVSGGGGGSGWGMLPFLAGLAVAVALAAAVAAPRGEGLGSSQVVLGALAAIAWAVFAVFGPTVLGIDGSPTLRPGPLTALALLALGAALAALALAARGVGRAASSDWGGASSPSGARWAGLGRARGRASRALR